MLTAAASAETACMSAVHKSCCCDVTAVCELLLKEAVVEHSNDRWRCILLAALHAMRDQIALSNDVKTFALYALQPGKQYAILAY